MLYDANTHEPLTPGDLGVSIIEYADAVYRSREFPRCPAIVRCGGREVFAS